MVAVAATDSSSLAPAAGNGTVQSPTCQVEAPLHALRLVRSAPKDALLGAIGVEQRPRDGAVAADGRGHLLGGAVHGEGAGERRAARRAGEGDGLRSEERRVGE